MFMVDPEIIMINEKISEKKLELKNLLSIRKLIKKNIKIRNETMPYSIKFVISDFFLFLICFLFYLIIMS